MHCGRSMLTGLVGLFCLYLCIVFFVYYYMSSLKPRGDSDEEANALEDRIQGLSIGDDKKQLVKSPSWKVATGPVDVSCNKDTSAVVSSGGVKVISSRGVDVSEFSSQKRIDDVEGQAVIISGWKADISDKAKETLLEPFTSMECTLNWIGEGGKEVLAVFFSRIQAARACRTKTKDPRLTVLLLKDISDERKAEVRTAFHNVEIIVPARPKGKASVASRIIIAALGGERMIEKQAKCTSRTRAPRGNGAAATTSAAIRKERRGKHSETKRETGLKTSIPDDGGNGSSNRAVRTEGQRYSVRGSSSSSNAPACTLRKGAEVPSLAVEDDNDATRRRPSRLAKPQRKSNTQDESI